MEQRTFNPILHHRRSIRLRGYDYSQAGAYFVTVCTRDRNCVFGEIVAGEMRANEAGRVAQAYWCAIPEHFPHVVLDSFVVMPNHVHGILQIVDQPHGGIAVNGTDDTGAEGHVRVRSFRSPTKTIGSIVRGFKIGVTKWMRTNGEITDVWQRSYYEHVIRDEDDLQRIRRYIADNPAQWTEDSEHPSQPRNS